MRSPSELELWKKVIEQTPELLALTENEDLSSPLDKNLLRIDSGFVFEPAPQDVELSYLHVEPLLDQAADLLDRAIRDRSSAEDLIVKRFELAVALQEFKNLDEVTLLEESAGKYSVPHDMSKARAGGGRSSVKQYRKLRDQYNAILDDFYKKSELDVYLTSAYRAGFASAYSEENDPTKKISGVTRSIADHVGHENEAQARFNALIDRGHVIAQELSYALMESIQDAENLALSAQENWDKANIEFQKKRTIIARQLQDIKFRAATQADGALNYTSRIERNRISLQQDFRNALARLSVVAKGLDHLYGYTDPLPDPKSLDFLDDCVLWTRRAIEYLVRFSRQDQATVIPISLKSFIKDSDWTNGMAAGRWVVTLPSDLFKNFGHVRLRGLTAFVEGTEKDLWQVRVRPPVTSSTVHLNNTTVNLDQKMVPDCYFNRATTRDSIREPDTTGQSSLYNASPVGEWAIEVGATSLTGTARAKIQDIVIDLIVVFRSRPKV